MIMAQITNNKFQLLECENKLLLAQQQNYKELCKIITQRHVEILKYLNLLKNTVEKIISLSKENVLYANYYSEKSLYETNILKYDKIIQNISETIQSSQAKISDNEGNLFKEQLKLLSNSLVDLSNKNGATSNIISGQKFRCDYFDCSEEFNSKNLLETHIQNHHIINYTNESSHDFYNKKDLSTDPKLNDVIFVPQMELEVLDYNNSSSYSNILNSQISSLGKQSNVYKKMALCEYCGKYFNKHYLASHKRSHTGARPYKCSINGCNRTFTQTSSRNVHEKRVHNFRKFDFKCTYLNCDISFDNMNEMQKHVQQHQALINTVMTHQFDQSISPKNDVENQSAHLASSSPRRGRPRKSGYFSPSSQNVSGGDVPNNSNFKHICQHCGKAFAYKVAMKQHLALHGTKNFRCTYENCNYASYWKHNLGLHMKKHHTQNDPSNLSTIQ